MNRADEIVEETQQLETLVELRYDYQWPSGFDAIDTLDGRLSHLELHHLVNDVQLFAPKIALS